MSDSTLSVAVIGAGMAGRSHAAAYRAANTVFSDGLPPIRLAAIADANAELAADAARRYGYEKAVTSWEEIVEDASIREHRGRQPAPPVDRRGADQCRQARAVREAARRDGRRRRGDGRRRARRFGGHRGRLHLPTLARGLGDPRPRPRRRARGHDRVRRPVLGRLRLRSPGPPELAVQGWSRLRGSRRRRVPRDRPRRVRLRSDRVGVRRIAVDADRETAPAPRRRGRARRRAGQRRAGEVENEDSATFSARFASGFVGSFSVSRTAFGSPNGLAFDAYGLTGSAHFDWHRPAEYRVNDAQPDTRTRGPRQVIAGPQMPYFAGGYPMEAPGVGGGNAEMFTFQARAFLDQVAGVADPLPRNATFAEVLRTMSIIRAVVRSSEQGGATVETP